MSTGVSTSTDKIIVDKSRSHRNKAVSRAVRATRERLQTATGISAGLEREMLQLHIASVVQSALVIPSIIVMIAAIGIYLTQEIGLMAWAVFALSVHAIGMVVARGARGKDITVENVQRWQRRFLAALDIVHVRVRAVADDEIRLLDHALGDVAVKVEGNDDASLDAGNLARECDHLAIGVVAIGRDHGAMIGDVDGIEWAGRLEPCAHFR